jgi:CHAT domain-containing protein
VRCSQTAVRGRRNVRAAKGVTASVLLVITACSFPRPPEASLALAKAQYQHGQLVEATRTAEAGYRSFQNQPQALWHWKFKLLLAEFRLLDIQTGSAESLLITPPPEQFAALRPRYQMLQAYVAFRRERGAEAEALSRQALAGCHMNGDYETEADLDLLQAAFLLDRQRAETAAKDALTVSTQHGLLFQRAAAFLDLGMVEVGRAHFGDAIPDFEESGRIANSIHADDLNSLATGNLATCYYNLGDFPRALRTREQVLLVQKRCGSRSGLRDSYLELGNTYLLQKDERRAIQNFHTAMKYVRKEDSPRRFAMIASGIAEALIAAGSLDEAEQYNKQALDTTDRGDKSQLAEIHLNNADLLARRFEHEKAIDAYNQSIRLGAEVPSVLWRAHAGLALEYAEIGNIPAATRSFDSALSVIERNRSEQLSTDYQITFLSELIRFYQEYVTFLIDHGQTGRALEVADSSRAAVLREALNGTAQAPISKIEARTRLVAKQASSVFLFYWLAPKRSYLWVIGPKGTKVVPLPPEQSIRQDVESYSYLIQQEKIDPLTNTSGVGKRLFDTLIAPACIRKGSQVVIVPDGPLHSLNFETLPVYSPVPHYWLEDVTLSIAPSLSVVSAAASNGRADKPLLLIGNTVTGGTGFPPLPESGQEIENIKRHFPAVRATMYTGPGATTEAYIHAHPDRFRYIHFATHADANEQSPLDSAIILSPRQNAWKLYARDVAEIPLTADLVTISACRSAGARTLAGEGLVGFAWAFFQAGARNVVTSLWDVNDRSTARLMDNFYAQVASGKPYDTALRTAKIELIREGYAKPYYWGPFQLSSRFLDIDPKGVS